MKKLAQLLLATGLMTTACAASAQGLTEAQARAAIAPGASEIFSSPLVASPATTMTRFPTATSPIIP